MYSQIWHQVSGTDIKPTHFLTLCDFQRFCLLDRPYPGMVRKKGCEVNGVVYSAISADTFERLDAFEGSEYVRTAIRSEIGDLQTYLLQDLSLLTDEIWKPTQFDPDGTFSTYAGWKRLL